MYLSISMAFFKRLNRFNHDSSRSWCSCRNPFGSGAIFGMTVIDNVMNVIGELGSAGFGGLVGLCVLFALLTAK